MKWSFESPSMRDSLLVLVKRAEQTFGRGFVVVADSGYPASSILFHNRSEIKSTFLVSVSAGKVSGRLRRLQEAAQPFLAIGDRTLLWYPTQGLVAYICRHKKYTQTLVTNACQVLAAPPPKPALHSMSCSQASCLTDNFTIDEMVAQFSWPGLTQAERDGILKYPLQYVGRMTGQDLTSPIDANGYVSLQSLNPISTSAVQAIAEGLHIKKTGRNKKQLMEEIVRRHPRALPPTPPNRTQSKKRKASADDASMDLAKSLKRDAQGLANQLLGPEEMPDFAAIYRSNYGLQDRFNAVLYSHFHQTASKLPGSRYSWMFFYICLFDSFVLRTEFLIPSAAEAQEELKPRKDEELPVAVFPEFLLRVVSQIADEYVPL